MGMSTNKAEGDIKPPTAEGVPIPGINRNKEQHETAAGSDTEAIIKRKRERMEVAAGEKNYMLAGKLQEEIKKLEELEQLMNRAVTENDFISAGNYQAKIAQAGRDTEETDETKPSPFKKPKDIRTLLVSQEFEFINKLAQDPREELFGRHEAKEVVIKYIKECTSMDRNVFVGSKFKMLGTSGVKGIGKTELQTQICRNWVKEIPDTRAIYASYNGGGWAEPFCTDLKSIEKNLANNGRDGYYMDSLGHLLLVSCGVKEDIATQVPIDMAMEYIRSKVFDRDDSAGVLVICVDEIIALTTPVPGYFNIEKSQMNLAEVIMSQCMGLQDKEMGRLIFIFTALLESMYTNLVSGSGRVVERLPLSLIPLGDVFGRLLTENLKTLIQTKPAVHQLVLSCAGHPRAVMDGLLEATEGWSYEDDIGPKKINTARDEIIKKCKFELDYINDEILAKWFDAPPLDQKQREGLLSKGILHEAVEGVEYLFPLLLQRWADKKRKISVFAYHLDRLFDADAVLDKETEKYMEPIMYHYEAVRRKAMAGRRFDLKSFYKTDHVGAKFRTRQVTAPVPEESESLVQYVENFEDLETVLELLEDGYIVVSEKHGEAGIEYLAPYRTTRNDLLVACVQCKFVQTSVNWSTIKTQMSKAVIGLKEKKVMHFPVIYTTCDQRSVLESTCMDGVYLLERDVFAFTNRLGILRLHTQKLGKALVEEYPFLERSAIIPL